MTQYGGPALLIPIYTLTGIYCIVLTPLSIFYLNQLWHLSSNNIPFFTKRHPKLIIFSVILFNIYPTILRPFADLSRGYGIFHTQHPFPRAIVNIMQWFLLLEYMRLWLLYYDYQYSLHSLSLKWKEQILKEDTHTPWTHKYRWLGNGKILSIISGVCGSIFILIIVGGEMYFGQSFLSLIQLIPMLSTMLMLIIAFKVRKCRDEFMIQKEFRIYGISLLSVILLYIIIQKVSVAGSNMRFILMNMFTCLCCYIMIFVSTHWVIKQYKLQNEDDVPLLRALSLSETKKDIDNRLSLEDVLSTKDGFDLFANHLVKEFAIENLFYIFEMVQMKHELVTHQLLSEGDIGVMVTIDFHRMDRLRRKDSHIYTVDEMKRNIKYIMDQYINMDGEYAINISSDTRKTLRNEYGKLKHHNEESNGMEHNLLKEYMSMFDESMEEIIYLMRSDSLTRFYQSAEYKSLMETTVRN